jgi:hypothetical protein
VGLNLVYCFVSRIVLFFSVVGFHMHASVLWVERFYLGNLYCMSLLASVCISIGPDIRQDYPLNLSILISGGKETNQDSPSNGE